MEIIGDEDEALRNIQTQGEMSNESTINEITVGSGKACRAKREREVRVMVPNPNTNTFARRGVRERDVNPLNVSLLCLSQP
jgi:hypothetical protein